MTGPNPFNWTLEQRETLMAAMGSIKDGIDLVPPFLHPLMGAAFATVASALSFTMASNEGQETISRQSFEQAVLIFQKTAEVTVERLSSEMGDLN